MASLRVTSQQLLKQTNVVTSLRASSLSVPPLASKVLLRNVFKTPRTSSPVLRTSSRSLVTCAAFTEPSTVKIVVQGRNINVTDAIKSYAEEKIANAVHNYEGSVKEVDVKLSVRGGDRGTGQKQQKTEITIYTLRNGVVRAEDVEDSIYASIDLVCDKVTRKLRKVKEKAISKGKWPGRGGPKGGENIVDSLDQLEVVDKLPTDQVAAIAPEIVREKVLDLEPMSQEDALDQLLNVGHDWFLFRNEKTGQVQILYKRKAHGYGVIGVLGTEK